MKKGTTYGSSVNQKIKKFMGGHMAAHPPPSPPGVGVVIEYPPHHQWSLKQIIPSHLVRYLLGHFFIA